MEMKSRVQTLVRQEVWVSTFHATCLRILRMDGPAIGMDKHFTIYDEHDQLVLIKECIRELNMNEKQVHPKGVRERIQRAKELITGSSLSLTQISLECGFCDQAHFCHMFTRSEGVNPMTWRNHQLRHKPREIAA